MPRHQRPRQSELIGGNREAARAHDADETLHGAKPVHISTLTANHTIVYEYATMPFAFSGLCAQMSKSIVACKCSRARTNARRTLRNAPGRMVSDSRRTVIEVERLVPAFRSS